MTGILNLLLIVIAAVLITDLLGRRIEDVLPPVVFALLLILYCVALLGKAHHSYQGTLILFAALWVFYIVKKKRLFPSLDHLKKNVITSGFVTYLAVLAVLFIAYSTHFVTVWDDFHYNATFPKDMFYYGTMPYGNHSATYYRSYPPLMQLFFYWGFQGIGSFSEPLMFRYKMFLIYTCLLPLYKRVGYRTDLLRSLMMDVVITAMPFLFMYELMESLSMDTFMAMLFAYAVTGICFTDRHDRFDQAGIILSLSCLTLVKQIAPIFTAIALFTWAVSLIVRHKDNKRSMLSKLPSLIPWLIAAGMTVGSWYSWKHFCSVKGNSVYLSSKLLESITASAGGINSLMSEYGNDTVTNFLKALITCHTSLEKNGLTLIITLAVAFAASFLAYKATKDRIHTACTICMTAGLGGYLLVLLYTYLFVFEEWEAKSLSSIDRYLGTYALALMYTAVYQIMMTEKRFKWVLPAFTTLTLICFPWKSAYANLVPAVYSADHSDTKAVLDEVAVELSAADPAKLEPRCIMVVNSETNSVYSRGLIYDLIPHIPVEYHVENSEEQSSDLLEKCRDESVYYVYFSDHLANDGKKSAAVTGALEDGVSLKSGMMYRYDEERNIITEL